MVIPQVLLELTAGPCTTAQTHIYKGERQHSGACSIEQASVEPACTTDCSHSVCRRCAWNRQGGVRSRCMAPAYPEALGIDFGHGAGRLTAWNRCYVSGMLHRLIAALLQLRSGNWRPLSRLLWQSINCANTQQRHLASTNGMHCSQRLQTGTLRRGLVEAAMRPHTACTGEPLMERGGGGLPPQK